MKTSILIVDDHEKYRNVLKELINREADMEVIGEAKNGKRAVELASELQPDIILMDIKMPVMDGIEATRQILAKKNGIKILALSIYPDESFKSDMLRSGALGYILKGCDFEELSGAIRKLICPVPIQSRLCLFR